MSDSLGGVDVLSDAITAMRTGVPHASRTLKVAPWGLRFGASDGAGFHVVLDGAAWLLPVAAAPIALGPGDVVFLPHGHGHALADHPDSPLAEVRPLPDGRWTVAAGPDRGAAGVQLMCGAYRLRRSQAHPLLTGLPEVVHVPAGDPALDAAVGLPGGELSDGGPGAAAVVPALLDTLLLYIVRAWLRADAGRTATGWAAALADPGLAAALHAVHEDPARPWTVRELGAVAGLSRAAFARRFSAVVGQPPLTYLTWWRMTLARRLLAAGDLPLRVVAARSGYANEFAFAKAFKREAGIAPGGYRIRRSGA
ncbi:AraC family transcriptional regulator [Actinoplanes octamycinicus]|uniref:AraC family transcriptional regulator n=1 Tax=Actinoplanes octamycinicus TaxID=135948 RepID=UPI0035EEF41C